MEQICLKLRPDWDGTLATTVSEAITLSTSPVTLFLLAATIICIRFRSQWGALVTVMAWSFYTGFLTMIDPSGLLAAGRAEGCVGSPALFIGAVTAICVGMILYTAPNEKRET